MNGKKFKKRALAVAAATVTTATALLSGTGGMANADTFSLGDVNLDGKVDLEDAQITLKAALNIISLDSISVKTADAVQDDQINLNDVQKVLKMALNIEPSDITISDEEEELVPSVKPSETATPVETKKPTDSEGSTKPTNLTLQQAIQKFEKEDIQIHFYIEMNKTINPGEIKNKIEAEYPKSEYPFMDIMILPELQREVILEDGTVVETNKDLEEVTLHDGTVVIAKKEIREIIFRNPTPEWIELAKTKYPNAVIDIEEGAYLPPYKNSGKEVTLEDGSVIFVSDGEYTESKFVGNAIFIHNPTIEQIDLYKRERFCNMVIDTTPVQQIKKPATNSSSHTIEELNNITVPGKNKVELKWDCETSYYVYPEQVTTLEDGTQVITTPNEGTEGIDWEWKTEWKTWAHCYCKKNILIDEHGYRFVAADTPKDNFPNLHSNHSFKSVLATFDYAASHPELELKDFSVHGDMSDQLFVQLEKELGLCLHCGGYIFGREKLTYKIRLK